LQGVAWNSELERWLREQAASVGFDAVGVAPVFPSEDAAEKVSAERFAEWIDSGYAGEMEYLKRRDECGTLLRSGVRIAMPWARSVVVCAMNYNAAAPLSIDPAPPDRGWIARYAWSGKVREADEGDVSLVPSDYHDELLLRLRRVEVALHERFSCETRCYVDTGPLVERTLAARAGVGWIGKNTCVINQQLGSWLLLAVIITSVPVAAEVPALIAANRCGSCTRCIDACPTGALIAAREMDASRCIAYLTIEKKKEIAPEFRDLIGRQVFGCDICQDVCPWNRRAPITPHEGMLPRQELMNPTLEWLASLDARDFRRFFQGSPLERTGRKRLHRNVAIAMGNSGLTCFLPQLEEWSTAQDPVLAEAAQWAIEKIEPTKPPLSSQ
jgi:epoxyqueuosine reductase